MSKLQISNNNFYHIYNRGTEKRKIFLEKFEYSRFLELLFELNTLTPIGSLYRLHKKSQSGEKSDFSPLVEIVGYCLLPNHYHLLVKQINENGIAKFMQRLGTGHTNYFNKKYARSGSLFQGKYKMKEITSQNQLEYVLAYVLGNSEIHKVSRFEKWKWTSYHSLDNYKLPVKGFKNKIELKKYIKEVIKNSINIKEDLKKYLIE